ncbi:hypothetical protein DOTSEDRAFT_91596 [Dothistroma septosporum NZE10]|uniref:amidase n=1 Tax=Dothistroma septosporum (strain NZE10 / CBS 128990) TaxID=675120 RepID=M2YJM5_DOTSN|nr:hypothetical protein DOTSEDRAFT_91596 [Dothistroma septosporum NZE10]
MGDTNGSSWQAKAAVKREAELSKIPPAWRLSSEYRQGSETSSISVLDTPAKCGILTQEELLITQNFDAVSLAKVISNGSLKSEDVAIAFCKRAAIAQQLLNCLTETFFDDAIARGKWLDQYLVEHGKPVGPLHGVPVSIKDCFHYTGVQSTLGFVSFLDEPKPTTNSQLVDLLLDLGAILYCKTNIPLTLMTADTHNNVFGRTLNPHRLDLTAGGSSGGEGALVAIRGSVIGVGTDIGGSVRIPALCNGTYGFKPTPGRIPMGNGAWCSREGAPGFPACGGPLANSFEDIGLFTRSVIDAKPWNRDSSAIAYPWRADVACIQPAKLRIGYYKEDSEFPLHPPVRRALDTTTMVLAAAGHEIIPLNDTPSLRKASDIANDYWSLDNTKVWLQYIEASGEPVIPSLQPRWVKAKENEGEYTLDDVFRLNVESGIYKDQWHALWTKNKLDVVLCPGAQNTAVPHDTYAMPRYTVVWNLLQYPGIMIPVGKADKDIDRDELAVADSNRTYRAEEVHGAPTSIQLVTRPFQDEELISAARVVDRCLNIAKRNVTRGYRS